MEPSLSFPFIVSFHWHVGGESTPVDGSLVAPGCPAGDGGSLSGARGRLWTSGASHWSSLAARSHRGAIAFRVPARWPGGDTPSVRRRCHAPSIRGTLATEPLALLRRRGDGFDDRSIRPAHRSGCSDFSSGSLRRRVVRRRTGSFLTRRWASVPRRSPLSSR